MRAFLRISLYVFMLFLVTGCNLKQSTINHTYTIEFNSNGGSEVAPITGLYYINISEPIAPSKEGYTFSGWYIDQNYTTPYVFDKMPNENLTLYAKWSINQYRISFETNGGNTLDTITQDFNTDVQSPITPVKEGFTFGGWFKDSDFTEGYTFSKMPSENLTLYAKWVQNIYRVQFLDYNDQLISELTIPHGLDATAPIAPTREDYLFAGWDKEFTNVQSDLHIYATYIENKLDDAINVFQFSFETGDDISGIRGATLSFVDSYDDTIYYLFESSDDDTVVFDLDNKIATIVHGNEDKVVNITVFAYLEINNIPYEVSKTISLTVLKAESYHIVDKEDLIVEVDQSVQDGVDQVVDFYRDRPYYLLPSTGDVNLLVIPIQFPNDTFKTSELNTLYEGFFGDGSDFESLKSYYLKSSYGLLHFSGNVLQPFTAEHHYEYYDAYSNGFSTGVDLLIEEAIAYYSTVYPTLDLSIYDAQGDGYLDGVHFVYSAPVDYESDTSIYWAYQYFYFPTRGMDDASYVSWGEYDVDAYAFSGMDFFYEFDEENAWTIIHETGHLLGLDDYYDYTGDGDSNVGGLGNADMMDATIGDHNAFSKLILDWIDPIVVKNNCTITINPFESSGDMILIGNPFDDIFDEYFVLEFYTPDNLNSTNHFFTEKGLLMYHVDAKLITDFSDVSFYSYYFLNNNTDTSHKLIKIEEADGNDDISTYGRTAENSDLLQAGESYQLIMYDHTVLAEVTVVEITNTTMTLTFDFS